MRQMNAWRRLLIWFLEIEVSFLFNMRENPDLTIDRRRSNRMTDTFVCGMRMCSTLLVSLIERFACYQPEYVMRCMNENKARWHLRHIVLSNVTHAADGGVLRCVVYIEQACRSITRGLIDICDFRQLPFVSRCTISRNGGGRAIDQTNCELTTSFFYTFFF